MTSVKQAGVLDGTGDQGDPLIAALRDGSYTDGLRLGSRVRVERLTVEDALRLTR